MKGFGTYILLINVITFAVFGIDKFKAIKHKWRVKEAVLFGLSLMGGSLGGLLAMYLFRHKTRKLIFVIGIPLILILQMALVYYLASL